MLRYKTETRPGLLTLYNIRPGNGAGPFLQPQRPHGTIPGSFTNSLVNLPIVNADFSVLLFYI